MSVRAIGHAASSPAAGARSSSSALSRGAVDPSADADLIVVGAGPKAVALAAKVHVINELELARISLTIVEEVECGASWFGANGMTSGEEVLAISPLKDVGFPYESHLMFGASGAAIDGELAGFSWQRHLIEQQRYARWLNTGSPSVRHREYGDYLAWALGRASAGVALTKGRAARISLDLERDGWVVDVVGRAGSQTLRGQALVLSGTGVHRPLSHDADAAPRVFHCDGPRSEFARIRRDRESDVAIVGGGDSALSCALHLRDVRPDSYLTIYTPRPPLSRAEGFLENRVFSDPDCVAWECLDVQARRAFIEQTDRGVFDPGQLGEIVGDERCQFLLGRVTHVAAVRGGVEVRYAAPRGPAVRRHDYVVNCTGFDLLRQVRPLFPPAVRSEIDARVGRPIWDVSGDAEIDFGRMLEIAGLHPRLHIPGLAASSQGPGFANLGCLGLLSNRILAPFLSDDDRIASFAVTARGARRTRSLRGSTQPLAG